MNAVEWFFIGMFVGFFAGAHVVMSFLLDEESETKKE